MPGRHAPFPRLSLASTDARSPCVRIDVRWPGHLCQAASRLCAPEHDVVTFCTTRPLRESCADASMAQRGIHDGTGWISQSGIASAQRSRCSQLARGLSPPPARADRCDDIARQLKSQIDGAQGRFHGRHLIYLSHPAAKELSLGCRGRTSASNCLPRPTRKPKPAFYRPGRAGDGDRLHGAEGRHAERRFALHEADGPAARRRLSRCATAGSTWLQPHQDRGVDRDLARKDE